MKCGADGEMASGDWLLVLGKSTPMGLVVSMPAIDLYQRPASVSRDNDMVWALGSTLSSTATQAGVEDTRDAKH